jgi:hypothetical protein
MGVVDIDPVTVASHDIGLTTVTRSLVWDNLCAQVVSEFS